MPERWNRQGAIRRQDFFCFLGVLWRLGGSKDPTFGRSTPRPTEEEKKRFGTTEGTEGTEEEKKRFGTTEGTEGTEEEEREREENEKFSLFSLFSPSVPSVPSVVQILFEGGSVSPLNRAGE
ncbi:hypothetical protein [Sorangium sp. So ce1024]|uniref:hypothetical protein n=1 Tax=Sorangium sp. So ce1024 TaxID=3133327 RepID=UPI003F0CF22A